MKDADPADADPADSDPIDADPIDADPQIGGLYASDHYGVGCRFRAE